jgi:hypothetical protein
MGIAAAILLAWQLARIPLEGSVNVSLDHARSVLDLERALSLDVEGSLIRFGSGPTAERALDWAYGEIHVPVLFGFLAAACVLAPDRYPRLRTIFFVSFIPAVAVIALYPLAPPHWLVELGLGPEPTQEELTGTLSTMLQNSTAAAASQHFGFAVFVALGALWLFPRSPVAWIATLYPALIFVVIVGTGNHYVLDCVVGVLTFAFGAAVAWLVHRGDVPAPVNAPGPLSVARTVVGVALVASGVESFEAAALGAWTAALTDGVLLVVGTVLVLWPRLRGHPSVGERAWIRRVP